MLTGVKKVNIDINSQGCFFFYKSKQPDSEQQRALLKLPACRHNLSAYRTP